MKIQEIINHLTQQGTWVNWNKTRDVILTGCTEREVDSVGVCWVATREVLQQAKDLGIHFIISHENMLYEESTSPYKAIYEARNEKLSFCRENDITVYRCHDVWDMMPVYGVSDVWARDIGISFEPGVVSSYNRYAVVDLTVEEIAQKVADAVKKYGQDGVQVVGDLNRRITRMAMGTGAATNVFSMLHYQPELVIVSEDGINSWIAMQYCIDHNIAIVICNHAACEIGGLKEMAVYLKQVFPHLEVTHLYEGYHLYTVQGKQ